MRFSLKSTALIVIAAFATAFTIEKEKIAYRLFDAKGKVISYKKMLDKAVCPALHKDTKIE